MVGHPVRLEGARLPGATAPDGRPTILSITEQDFVGWFLDRMGSEAGRTELGTRDVSTRQNEAGQVRLFQPVHRSFNLIVVEAFCEVEGLPRLDPAKILKAGATVRRVVGGDALGWVTSGGRILGWRDLPTGATREGAVWDPDPAARALTQQGRNHAVLKHATALDAEKADYAETSLPLYPAPPGVCKALGRTVLFGYLPLTSSDRSEDNPAPEAPFTDADVLGRLPAILQSAERLEDSDEVPPLADAAVNPVEASNPSSALATVIAGISYLAQEPGLFTRPKTNQRHATDTLRELLQGHRVEVHGRRGTRTLYNVLEDGYDLLIRRANDDGTQDDAPGTPNEPEPPYRLPVAWPEFNEAEEAQFVEAIKEAMTARWHQLSPGETRYQDLSARYEVQAFIRVDRSDCNCPPETVWTKQSPMIEIIPWYEGGEAPPTIVELPDVGEGLFDKLKPNVAFKVPESIQKFMTGVKLDKLIDGEKPKDKLGWGMICGFSIPIITICAFIVLQIFLSLFHILFWWLPFIRICIPFPKPQSPPPPGGG